MKAAFATLAIAGLAVAAPHNSHASFHKKDLESTFEGAIDGLLGGTNIVKDFSDVIDAGNSFMSNLKAGWTSVLAANNSQEANTNSWVGDAVPASGNAIVNTVVNKSGKNATWICWESAAAGFLTTIQPQIAVAVPTGHSVNISHAIGEGTGNSGACSLMFDGDKLNFVGQVANSWFEYTFVNSQFSTFDLSMEANMSGHNVSIAGPECTSDLNRCSFHCTNGQNSCMAAGDYTLLNCEANSQVGAMTGTFAGAASGGCMVGGEGSGITNLVTTLH